MSTKGIEILQRRAREVRSRALIRRWEYRQRHHAKGTWGRLRRVLAEAAAAWSVPEREIRRLQPEGYPSEPVGAELEPPKEILWVPREVAEKLPDAESLPLRLGPEVLGARFLVLVRL